MLAGRLEKIQVSKQREIYFKSLKKKKRCSKEETDWCCMWITAAEEHVSSENVPSYILLVDDHDVADHDVIS